MGLAREFFWEGAAAVDQKAEASGTRSGVRT